MTGVNRPDSTGKCVLSGNSWATFDNHSQAGLQTMTRSLYCEEDCLLLPIAVLSYAVFNLRIREQFYLLYAAWLSHPWDLNP